MRSVLVLYFILGVLNFLNLALGRRIFYHEKISTLSKSRFSIFAVAAFVLFQAFSACLSLYFLYKLRPIGALVYLLISVSPFFLSPFSSGRRRERLEIFTQLAFVSVAILVTISLLIKG